VLARAKAQQEALTKKAGTGLKLIVNLIRGKAKEYRRQARAIARAAEKNAKDLTDSGKLLKVGSKVVGRTLIVVGAVSDGYDDYQNDTKYTDPGQRMERAIVVGVTSGVGALGGDVAGLGCLEFAEICSPIAAYAASEVLQHFAKDQFDAHMQPIGPAGAEMPSKTSGMA
jgi:hypothetical protein